MKTALSIAAFLIAAGLALPAQAQGMGGYQGEHNDILSTVPDAKDPESKTDPVGVAQDLRLKGKCDQALPMLRSIADNGAGYEISQVDLGMCLLDLARMSKDVQQAADQRKEGAMWILKAANAGFAKAQAQAAILYLDGTGVAADPVEAEKWALLYHHNSMRMAIGLPDIAPALSDRLDTVMTDAKREEAQARADAWRQTAQSDQ